MVAPHPRQRSTIRPRNTRHARYATWLFTAPMPIVSFSSKRIRIENMKTTLPMRSRRILTRWILVLGAALCGLPAAAQDPEQKGIDQGNYNIKQSIEFGGRFTSIGGDVATYDTFVNLQEGARLLGFTTEMQSIDHHATLFDRLYFSNFGYGGDPNSASRLRIAKNKLYNF